MVNGCNWREGVIQIALLKRCNELKVMDQLVSCLQCQTNETKYHHIFNFNYYTQLINSPLQIIPTIQHSQTNSELTILIIQSVSVTLQTMKFIEDICQSIVSPPKLRYSPFDLGSAMSFYGRRHDFQVLNIKGLKMQASYYESNKPNSDKICIIYLHSMNGSRLQSTIYSEFVLKMGVSFCNFDFTGCGNSEGNSISFGANQKNDVLAVVDSLHEQFNIERVILWGRSMGASSALKYCQLTQSYRYSDSKKEIVGLVLDSCFKSFDKLAVQIGSKHSELPQFMIKMGYYLIRSSLQEKGQFKIEQLQLQEVMGKIMVPTLFLTSPDDTTVNSQHSLALFNRCIHNRKKLAYIKGLHNEARDNDYLREVQLFMEELIAQAKVRPIAPRNRMSKFELIANQRRNFSVEGNEWDENKQCSCSLFPSPQKDLEYANTVSTTRRKQSQPFIQYEKIKINKMPANKFNFRSTKNLPQVAHFQLI